MYQLEGNFWTLDSVGHNMAHPSRNRRNVDAIRIFELNVRQFPMSSNVFDSFGDTLYRSGKRAEEAEDRGSPAAQPRHRRRVPANSALDQRDRTGAHDVWTRRTVFAASLALASEANTIKARDCCRSRSDTSFALFLLQR